MIITDMWGDFLTNADYVFNDNTLLKNAFGFNGSKKINDKTAIGFGYNYAPFLSFNYNYKEEVRSDADLEDGDAIMAWIGGQSSLAIWSGTQFGLAENEWYVQVPGSFTQESYYGFSLFMLVSNSGTLNWGGAI